MVRNFRQVFEKRAPASAAILVFFFSVYTALGQTWTKSMQDGFTLSPSDYSRMCLWLVTVSSIDGRLSGGFGIINGSLPVKLVGFKTEDDHFWPRSVLQVAQDTDGPRKDVRRIKKNNESTSVVIDEKNATTPLYIDFDPLRPLDRQIQIYSGRN